MADKKKKKSEYEQTFGGGGDIQSDYDSIFGTGSYSAKKTFDAPAGGGYGGDIGGEGIIPAQQPKKSFLQKAGEVVGDIFNFGKKASGVVQKVNEFTPAGFTGKLIRENVVKPIAQKVEDYKAEQMKYKPTAQEIAQLNNGMPGTQELVQDKIAKKRKQIEEELGSGVIIDFQKEKQLATDTVSRLEREIADLRSGKSTAGFNVQKQEPQMVNGMPVPVPVPEANISGVKSELVAKERALEDAKLTEKIYQDMLDRNSTPERFQGLGTIADLLKGVKGGAGRNTETGTQRLERIPLLGRLFKEANVIELARVKDKMAQGFDLTEQEQQMIKLDQARAFRAVQSNTTLGTVGEIAGESLVPSLQYMGERILIEGLLGLSTGGASASVSTAKTAKDLGKATKTVVDITNHILRTVGKEAIITGANPMAISADAMDRSSKYWEVTGGPNGENIIKLMNGEDVGTAYKKATAVAFINNFTESIFEFGAVKGTEKAIAKKMAKEAVGNALETADVLVEDSATVIAKNKIGQLLEKMGIQNYNQFTKFVKEYSQGGVENIWDFVKENAEEELAEMLSASVEERQYNAPWTPAYISAIQSGDYEKASQIMNESALRWVSTSLAIGIQSGGTKSVDVLPNALKAIAERGNAKDVIAYRERNNLPPIEVPEIGTKSAEDTGSVSKTASKTNEDMTTAPQVPVQSTENEQLAQAIDNEVKRLAPEMQKDWEDYYANRVTGLQDQIKDIEEVVAQSGSTAQKSIYGKEIEKLQGQVQEIRQEFIDKWNETIDENVKINEPVQPTENVSTSAQSMEGATIVTEQPIKVYRGEGKGIGNTTFVKGKYYADTEEFAKAFGDKVESSEIPAGSKVFDFDKIKDDPEQTLIPQEILVDPDKLTDYLIEQGFDATKNTNTRGVEYVLLNSTEKKLRELAQSMSRADFLAYMSEAENYAEYRDEVKRVSEQMNEAEKAQIGSGGTLGYIWVKANGDKALTQEEKVKQSVQGEEKSIKQIAEETNILEPNVRRILGVGTKEGVFKRVAKGVYTLSNNGKELAYIIPADSIDTLPKLAEEGFKADMVFLDIPYNTPAVKGGNRGMKYEFITPEQFNTVLEATKKILRDEDSALLYMFSQAKSGLKAMQEYNDLLDKNGFKVIAKGNWQKLFQNGKPVTNVRGEVSEPEGILLLSQSGKLTRGNIPVDLNFELVRPKGYQSEKNAEMLNKMIQMTTDEGDVVLDPFAGSGVTVAEAVKTGRTGVGIEKNEEVAKNTTVPRVQKAVDSVKTPSIDIEKLELGKDMTAKQLRKNGFSEEAMGYGEYADVLYTPEGEPVIAMRYSDDRPYPIMGFSVAEKFRRQGIGEAFLRREMEKDPNKELYIDTPNEDMLRLMNRIGEVTEPDISVEYNVTYKVTPRKETPTKTTTTPRELAGILNNAGKVNEADKFQEVVNSGGIVLIPRIEIVEGATPVEKVSSIYKQMLEEYPQKRTSYMTTQDRYLEEMNEQIENPNRYNTVFEDSNEKGIKIGDWVKHEDEKWGKTVAIVTTVQKEEYRKGGYAVKVQIPGGGGGFYDIETVEKIQDARIVQGGGESATISNGQQNKTTQVGQEQVSNTGEVPTSEDRGSGTEASGETQDDRDTGTPKSRNGSSRNGVVARQKLNEQAVSILESKKYSINRDDYTGEELDILTEYSGAGGKEKAGAEGVGLLSEYYTPHEVAKTLWQIVNKYLPKYQTVHEPSVGVGTLLRFAPEGKTITANEYSKVSGTITKLLYPNVDVVIGDSSSLNNPGDFQAIFHRKKDWRKVDLVIGNPPFGERQGYLKGAGEEPKIGRWEEYFIKRGLDMTNNGGLVAYVVNSSMIDKGDSYAKTEISKQGELIRAFRLPEGIFADTTVGTDIVIFVKKPTTDVKEIARRKAKLIDQGYFWENGDDVLGEIETRKNRFGQAEEYVKGDISDLRRINLDGVTETQVNGNDEVITTTDNKPVSKVFKPKEPRVRTYQKEGTTKAIITPDKKKVETVKEQMVTDVRDYTPVEVEILKNTDVFGATPFREDGLRFLNYQQGKYYHNGLYFSGEILEKLEQLERDKDDIVAKHGEAQYEKQKKGLEKILPKRLTINDIALDPLDRFITDQKAIGGKNEDSTVGSEFARYMWNDHKGKLPIGVQVNDIVNYVQRNRARPGTKEVMHRIKEASNRLFNEFVRLHLDEKTQKIIVDRFNEEKNSYVQVDYSIVPVIVEGMAKYYNGNPFVLSKTQVGGISMLTNKGVGLVAYGVGVGKTHTLLVATMIEQQKGRSNRPLFVVPKSTLQKTWIATARAMFPDKTFVNLGGLTVPDIKRLTNERGADPKKWIKDGEVAFITHEGLLNLDLTKEEKEEALKDIQDALDAKDVSTKTKRGQEKDDEGFITIIGQAQGKAKVLISELGIDHLSVDEVHNFRKVFQGAKASSEKDEDKGHTRRFANVIGGTPSKQAQQLFILSQYIQRRRQGRGVFLASATPFENHATEVYNILSFMASARMKRMGVFNINDFFSAFSNFTYELETNAKGEFVQKEKMKSFKNLAQLQSLLREFVDYQTDETLVRPDKKVLTPHLAMSEAQRSILAKIQDMLDPEGGAKPEDGAVLKASMYSVENSISPYFIREYHPEMVSAETLFEQSPKLQYALEAVKYLKSDSKTNKYGTFIYIGDHGKVYHNMIASYIGKQAGYKESEIAVINGDTKDTEREAIKEDFRSGKVKLLLGGSPTKEGIDLQNNGYATINLAIAWNPTEMAQVEGRVWRQGNARTVVPIIYPLVENSGDITIYGKFEEKGSRINDLFSYKGAIFDVGEIDPKEQRLALITDPAVKAKIDLEIDMEQLQDEINIAESEMRNVSFFKNELAEATQTLDYATERLKTTDKENWAYGHYKEQVELSKKRIAKAERFKSVTKIANFDDKLAEIKTQVDQLAKEKEAMKATIASRLEKYTKEYEEVQRSRSTIAEAVKELSGINQTVRERTQQELAEEKRRLQKKLEMTGGAGSVGADVGVNKTELIKEGTINVQTTKVPRVELPELVSLVVDMTGDRPKLTNRFRNALGKFYPGTRSIALKKSLFSPEKVMEIDAVTGRVVETFKDEDPLENKARLDQIASILAHEIGHLTKVVDSNVKNGASLLRHITNLAGDIKKIKPKNKQIKEELWRLSTMWRPLSSKPSEKEMKYRKSTDEIYADTISVLLNSPVLLQKEAPLFTDLFFRYLDNKPTVRDNYFALWDMINSGNALDDRIERKIEGYKKGASKRISIALEKKKEARKFTDALAVSVVSKFFPLYSLIDRSAMDASTKLSEKTKLKESLETLSYIDNDIYLFMTDITEKFINPLTDIGVSIEEVGALLEIERSLGDRKNIANPGAVQGQFAEDTLKALRARFSEEQNKVLDEAVRWFRDTNFDIVTKATASQIYSTKFYNEVAQVNKDSYTPFGVVKYIEKNNVGFGVYQMTGTISEIENPIITQVMKSMSIMRQTQINKAKLGVVDFLKNNFPEEIEEAQAHRDKKGKVTEYIDKVGYGTLKVYEDGKLSAYYVDPYIAKIFEKMLPQEQDAIVRIFAGFNRVFKNLVTTLKPSWAFYSNPIRDFKRTVRSIYAELAGPKMKLNAKLLFDVEAKQFFNQLGSLKEAWNFTHGRLSETTRELVKLKAIGTPTQIMSMSRSDIQENDNAVIELVLKQKAKMVLYKNEENFIDKIGKLPVLNMAVKILEVFKSLGATLDYSSKIAGYKTLQQLGKTGSQAGMFIRNYVGTPNFREGGVATPVTNTIIPFSNIAIQAIRTSLEMTTNPNTRSGYLMAMFMQNALKVVMLGIAAGLFGDELRDLLAGVSEYEKTNYDVIPLGRDPETGKVIYYKIPKDEESRIFGALMWKLGSAINGDLKKPEQLVSMSVGLIPTSVPLIDLMGAWFSYAQGRNPYDDFRGREAIASSVWKRGGVDRFVEMVKLSSNMIGLTSFKTYDSGPQSTTEAIVSNSPIIERMFGISDYGYTEAKQLAEDKQDQETSRLRKTQENRIEDVVKEVGQPLTQEQVNALVKELATQELGPKPYNGYTGEQKARETAIRKEVYEKQAKELADWYTVPYTRVNNVSEKVDLMEKQKGQLSEKDFNSHIKKLKRQGFISDAVVKEAYQRKVISIWTEQALLEIELQ